MSLSRIHNAALAATGALAGVLGLGLGLGIAPAHAQDVANDRFFAGKADPAETDKPGDDGDADGADETLIQGSLTSTTFGFREVGSAVLVGDNVSIDNASPVARLFTDLRGQVDAKHISGGSFDARVDARARVSNSCTLRSQNDSILGEQTAEQLYGGLCGVQSGTFGDAEYEAREVFIKRGGDTIDVVAGRQYVLDLAATKIDGVRVTYRTSKNWSWLGFGGLYPARGSRSIVDDYPVQEFVDGAGLEQKRVMPIAAGAGGAYRYQQMYGSVGVVGILPRAEEIAFVMDPADPANPIPQSIGQEALRAFVTASGYWRKSNELDLYHFAVADFQGTGRGLTNLSVGANYRPTATMRVTASINHVDTETLNVIAQEQLENPADVGGLVQNNVAVQRIASDSARVGVSVALSERRFEVSTAAQIRQRPDIRLDVVGGLDGQQELIGEARAAELLVSVVDRRSYRDWRLGALGLATFPAGGENLNRTRTRLVRAFGSKEISDGRGQIDVDVSFLDNTDDDRDVLCLDLVTCFGTSKVQTIGTNGTLVYRLKTDWLFVGNASLARQSIETTLDGPTPPNLLVSAFLRLAYRF